MKMIRQAPSFSVYMVVLLLLSSSGCASYSTRAVQMEPKASAVVTTNDVFCVSLDEYATETKCREAFDADLSKEGVLAVYVKVENKSGDTYEIGESDFTVGGGSPLSRISARDAAEKAKRNAVGRAIGWSLIVPIIAIPVAATASAVHTKGVNEKIEQDFVAKAFKGGPLLPGKERMGFLFFRLSDGRSDLRGLELEMTARNAGTGETVRIAAPLPEASFKSPKADSKASGSSS